MLAHYCQALGVDVFSPDFYGGPGVLVSHDPPVETLREQPARLPQDGLMAVSGADDDLDRIIPTHDQVARSLAEAQRHLGIVPGEADRLPG
jgi:hypothetical protein